MISVTRNNAGKVRNAEIPLEMPNGPATARIKPPATKKQIFYCGQFKPIWPVHLFLPRHFSWFSDWKEI